jgi:hypothetical protein
MRDRYLGLYFLFYDIRDGLRIVIGWVLGLICGVGITYVLDFLVFDHYQPYLKVFFGLAGIMFMTLATGMAFLFHLFIIMAYPEEGKNGEKECPTCHAKLETSRSGTSSL